MLFRMNASDLMEGLNTVTRALAARPAKQILEGVLIDADDDGIILTCSDGTLSIQSSITAQVSETGRCVLPGRLFTELVRKLPGGEVEVKIADGRKATISCYSSRFNLSGMNVVEYPMTAEIEATSSVKIQQNRLREMISRVVFSIATDETRQILTGCLLEVTADQARMVALDGYRLAMQTLSQPFTLPQGKDMLKAVIPGRVMNEMSKILPDDETFCTLSFDKGHMQADFGNTRITTILLAGEYIDYRRILPASFKTTVKAKRTEVQDAIDRASLMAREGKNNIIRFSFNQGSMTITSNAEMGDFRDEIECRLDGDPIDIAFNAKYIGDVVRNLSDDDVCMNFNTNVSPCVFLPAEGDKYLYLILPVRVFNA